MALLSAYEEVKLKYTSVKFVTKDSLLILLNIRLVKMLQEIQIGVRDGKPSPGRASWMPVSRKRKFCKI